MLFCLFISSCGRGNLLDLSDFDNKLDRVEPSFGAYHSYGDSITAGALLSNPATQAYPALVASFNSLPLSNYALAGDQACDVLTRQIFPHLEQPTLTQKTLYSLLVSTNDVGVKGIGPYQDVFNRCHQASIGWLAVPLEWKILASSILVSSSGPAHFELANNWKALVTDGLGASIKFPFFHPAAGPVYIWYRIIDGNSGTFNYLLDGNLLGSLRTGSQPLIETLNQTRDSLALLRLDSIPSGNHVLTFSQTSPDLFGMGIVAIGLPQLTVEPNMPRVLVGTTPRQRSGDRGPCSMVSTACNAYIADIKANVNLFHGDGLDVRIFDSHTYALASRIDMVDALHPNQRGNQELFLSVEDALQ